MDVVHLLLPLILVLSDTDSVNLLNSIYYLLIIRRSCIKTEVNGLQLVKYYGSTDKDDFSSVQTMRPLSRSMQPGGKNKQDGT